MTVIICSTVRCPYPNCGHTGDVITVNHCRTAHGMERKELLGDSVNRKVSVTILKPQTRI